MEPERAGASTAGELLHERRRVGSVVEWARDGAGQGRAGAVIAGRRAGDGGGIGSAGIRSPDGIAMGMAPSWGCHGGLSGHGDRGFWRDQGWVYGPAVG
jgi:hypothetical protein